MQAALRIYSWAHTNKWGLLPERVHTNSGNFAGDTYSIGSMADSYYEYLLKLYIQTEEPMFFDMWQFAMDEMLQKLVNTSGNTTWVGKSVYGQLQHEMEHLSCFLPGNLALGVQLGKLDSNRSAQYMEAAEGLAKTCYLMYNCTATGLAGEIVHIAEDGQVATQVPHNLLRPEAVESWMYLWRITGKPVYRTWSWEAFLAFEGHSRVNGGHSGILDVNKVPPQYDNLMQSFWLSETLKYLYLTFGPDDSYPFSEWVYSTEAHPLRLSKHPFQMSEFPLQTRKIV